MFSGLVPDCWLSGVSGVFCTWVWWWVFTVHLPAARFLLDLAVLGFDCDLG